LRARGPAPPLPHTEKIFEDVAETGEDVLEPGKTGKARPAQPFVAVPVIEVSFLRVPQDLVGLRGLFEFFFRFFVSGVAVRVVLEGLLAVNLFDVSFVGVSGDT
jgi:hypothetical protein